VLVRLTVARTLLGYFTQPERYRVADINVTVRVDWLTVDELDVMDVVLHSAE